VGGMGWGGGCGVCWVSCGALVCVEAFAFAHCLNCQGWLSSAGACRGHPPPSQAHLVLGHEYGQREGGVAEGALQLEGLDDAPAIVGVGGASQGRHEGGVGGGRLVGSCVGAWGLCAGAREVHWRMPVFVSSESFGVDAQREGQEGLDSERSPLQALSLLGVGAARGPARVDAHPRRSTQAPRCSWCAVSTHSHLRGALPPPGPSRGRQREPLFLRFVCSGASGTTGKGDGSWICVLCTKVTSVLGCFKSPGARKTWGRASLRSERGQRKLNCSVGWYLCSAITRPAE